MKKKHQSVWVSWEDHRRSRELASGLGVEFYPFEYSAPRWRRYPYLSILTVAFIFRKRPKIIFCQNPSIVLASIVVLMRYIFSYKLVVDRHSNFKFEHDNSKKIKWQMFYFLSKFTVKRADLTIITNDHLRKICVDLGGRAFVLQDRIPTMKMYDKEVPPKFMCPTSVCFNVMVVTTFNDDEPIEEIIEASKRLPSHFRLYLTGNYRKKFSDSQKDALRELGIVLTGFIDEKAYQSLMYHSELVVVLTKKEYILNCGAYEAISMNKPMILSNTITLKGYFKTGCLYANSDANDIYNKLVEAEGKKEKLIEELNERVPYMKQEWQKRFESLKEIVSSL